MTTVRHTKKNASHDPKRKRETFAFGPVPSRRLGRSLGIDVVPFKTCSYDCIYCQLGRTTHKTAKRSVFYPVEDVMSGVRARLDHIEAPDYLTVSGSGEPTLYAAMGDLIRRMKTCFATPLAVLTNGSLAGDGDVRRELAEADLLVPSLDAGNADTFQVINRPHKDIRFGDMTRGLCALRDEYRGQIWLEVFLVAGVNDTDRELADLKKWANRIGPDRIQLNTAVRPTAEDAVRPLPLERMVEIASFFGPTCEVVADYARTHEKAEFRGQRRDVLEMLKRRPCTIEDVAAGLSLHRNEAVKYVQELSDRREIQKREKNGKFLYFAVDSETNL